MKPFFCLQRTTYGNVILLTPFLQKKEVIDWDNEGIVVEVSSSADASLKETIQYRLYSAIDFAVDSWIQELKYIPRLINSAATFLVVYFFLSLVVRDPIPIIDEMVGSIAASIGVYLWTASKNRKSELAMKKRTEMKNLVDACTYRTEEDLRVYEDLLKQFDESAPIMLSDKISGNNDQFSSVSLPMNAPQIHEYLGMFLSQQEKNKNVIDQLAVTLMSGKRRKQLAARLLSQTKSRKIDLPLIALYMITAGEVNQLRLT